MPNDRYKSYVARGVLKGSERKNTDLAKSVDSLEEPIADQNIRQYWVKHHAGSDWERNLIYLTSDEFNDAINRFEKNGKVELFDVDPVSIDKVVRTIIGKYDVSDLSIQIDKKNGNASIKTKDAEKQDAINKMRAADESNRKRFDAAKKKATEKFEAVKADLPNIRTWFIEVARQKYPKLVDEIERRYETSLDDLINLEISNVVYTNQADEPIKYDLIAVNPKTKDELYNINTYYLNRFLNFKQSKDTLSVVAHCVKIILRHLLIKRPMPKSRTEEEKHADYMDALINDYTDDLN